MTTPDIDYDKYLGVVTPRFKLLEKTEQDAVWAALPGQFQMVLTQLKRCDMFEWGLVYMTKAYIDMQEEAGKKWSHRAPRDEAHDWIKVAKKLLDMHNVAQTVASTALTVDTHGVRLDGLDEHVAEQKTFKEEQKTTNAFVKKELDARKQDKNDLKMRLRNIEGDVREQKGKEAIVERVLTFNQETKEEELQRSLPPCGNQIQGAYHFTAPAC